MDGVEEPNAVFLARVTSINLQHAFSISYSDSVVVLPSVWRDFNGRGSIGFQHIKSSI